MNHDAHKSDTGLSQNTDSVTTDPAVTFENITFSDGTAPRLHSNPPMLSFLLVQITQAKVSLYANLRNM